MLNTAKALLEIGAVEQAIDFAIAGASLQVGLQAEQCAHLWCALVAEHTPAVLEAATLWVFDRWPSSANAAAVLPRLKDLISSGLQIADANNYKTPVRRLREIRLLSAALGQTGEARECTEQVRQQNKKRPRFLQELKRAYFL